MAFFCFNTKTEEWTVFLKETYFTMSDGVRLYTRIALPEEKGKYPIVFVRTPYEPKRGGEPYPFENYRDDLFLRNGYAIVLQHTRGRGDSEGECMPYQERRDGLDSLECIRALPFYDGEIYLYGGSYLATVHLCYLTTNPQDVKAAALSIQSDNLFFRNYRNGCCYRHCNVDWWMSMLKNRYPEQKPLQEALRRPYSEIMERAVGEDVPEYTSALLNDTYNAYWQKQENVHAMDALSIPVLFSEGWYDFYVDGMFSMWERMPAATRARSAFVVGPWGHATRVSDKAEYPLEHGDVPADYVVNFFNSVRSGAPYGMFELGKVNYYSVGSDHWATEPVATCPMKLYFSNDGALENAPSVTGEQSYAFDPDRSTGCFKYQNIYRAEKAGSVDGVLSFVSAPFGEDMDFFGKIGWHMKVRTDCDDTAFFMRVYLVEDGEAYNLTETITSLSHANENYVAGEECMIDISTPPMGFTVRKGCAIRVDVASHSDLYVPHSNVKGHWAKVTEARIASNTVICDDQAYITLPLCVR